MAARLVSVVQQKGGAGKTTITAQLSVAFSRMRQRIALIDLDPQASLSAWFDARKAYSQEPDKKITMMRLGAQDNLADAIDKMRRTSDLLLIDGPSHADAETRIAIRMAELVLVPCQPRPLDIWATRHVLSLVGMAGRQAMLVLNRVPARSRLTKLVCQQIISDNWPIARHALGERQAFAATIGVGHGVAEVSPDCRASQEVNGLAGEVLHRLACLGQPCPTLSSYD